MGTEKEKAMKAVTDKAKEKLAEVEKKVSKQLSKQAKANSKAVDAQAAVEKSKEDGDAKKADEQEKQNIKLSAQGKIQSTPGSEAKASYEVDAENAIAMEKFS